MKKARNLTKTIFIIYCGILIWTVLFKMAASPEELRYLTGIRKLNLIPFDYRGGIPRILIRETAMNVLVFIPFGFYLKMLGVSGGKTVFRNKKSTSWESWSDISPVGETKNFYPEIQPPRYGCQIIKFKVIKILIHKNI